MDARESRVLSFFVIRSEVEVVLGVVRLEISGRCSVTSQVRYGEYSPLF